MSWIDPRTDSMHPQTDRLDLEKPRMNPFISEPMPVLYTSVPSPRRAPHCPEPPVVRPGFGFDKSTWIKGYRLALNSLKCSRPRIALIANHRSDIILMAFRNEWGRSLHVTTFKKWIDVPELEADVTRIPNLKHALNGWSSSKRNRGKHRNGYLAYIRSS